MFYQSLVHSRSRLKLAETMTIPGGVAARMAASDTASLAAMGIDASADADKIAAIRRIIADLNVPIMRAKFVYADMMRQMAQADLTIN